MQHFLCLELHALLHKAMRQFHFIMLSLQLRILVHDYFNVALGLLFFLGIVGLIDLRRLFAAGTTSYSL